MLPFLGHLSSHTIGVREKRARSVVNYAETEEPEDLPHVALLGVEQALPGPLYISNARFVEMMVQRPSTLTSRHIGMVVSVTEGAHPLPSSVRYVQEPFRDRVNEPEEIIVEALTRVVAAVQEFWTAPARSVARRGVLVHCSAGQNRSAAAILAILLSSGLSAQGARDAVDGTSLDGWDKFVGESGERLREIVLRRFP